MTTIIKIINNGDNIKIIKMMMIIITIIIVIINSRFQPSEFSTGSTTRVSSLNYHNKLCLLKRTFTSPSQQVGTLE